LIAAPITSDTTAAPHHLIVSRIRGWGFMLWRVYRLFAPEGREVSCRGRQPTDRESYELISRFLFASPGGAALGAGHRTPNTAAPPGLGERS
jgi:hypothetical protein